MFKKKDPPHEGAFSSQIRKVAKGKRNTWFTQQEGKEREKEGLREAWLSTKSTFTMPQNLKKENPVS